MHLLIITGFLGSGKTTLTMQLAAECLRQGRKAAILVNEIGEIGIDSQLLRELDYNVWEMVNGCICCTIAADFIPTLQKLSEEYTVDLVLLEPSGAAEPGSILRNLRYYKGPLESVYIVTLLDPLRLAELYEVVTPLITKQIAEANLILITKSDVAAAEQIRQARHIAAEINPGTEPVEISLRQKLDEAILREILPWQNWN